MQPNTNNPNPNENVTPTPVTEPEDFNSIESQDKTVFEPQTQTTNQVNSAIHQTVVPSTSPVIVTPAQQSIAHQESSLGQGAVVVGMPIQDVTPQLVSQQAFQPNSVVSAAPTISPDVRASLPSEGETMFVGGDTGLVGVPAGGAQQPKSKFTLRKKLLIGGGIGAGIALLSSVYTFAFYIPNTPTNVWNTGMNRTGEQITALVDKLADPESAAQLQKTKLTVGGSMNTNDVKFTLNTTADETTSNSTLDLNADLSYDMKIDLHADAKTSLPTDALFPNIYFKITGFGSLGLDLFAPGISQYDNQWIAVEQDYLKQFEDSLGATSSESAKNITEEDVMSIVKDVNTVSQEYIFTSDPEKAVIQLGEFVATEDSEGIRANHYKASINKDNLEDYCIALVDKVSKNSVITEHYPMSAEDIADTKKSCKTVGDEIPDDTQFDLWIDKKYKLLHKIRFYEDLEVRANKLQEDKAECEANDTGFSGEPGFNEQSYCDYYDDMAETGSAYTEFGQIYKGDDTFLLFGGVVRDTNKDSYKARADITINAKQLTVDGKLSVVRDFEGDKWEGGLTIKTEPYAGEIDAAKPEGAIPLQQVIDTLMGPQSDEPEYSLTGAGINQIDSLSSWTDLLRN